MKVGLWGAGAVGEALAQRLVMSPFVSELHWINRTVEKIEARCIDLEHGLAFAPTCRRVEAYAQGDAQRVAKRVDVVLLVGGAAVDPGAEREAVYMPNRDLFRATILPALTDTKALILVVTNPVDLMARVVFRECVKDSRRVLGLGTVVETARLRAALGAWLSPRRHAREVWAYAVGTHDKNFVDVVGSVVGVGAAAPGAELIERAREEAALGAKRVRAGEQKTVQPIAEGVMAVFHAIASDSANILTVSVVDEKDADGLFYSVPCRLGHGGVMQQHREVLDAAKLKAGLDGLRATLRKAGE